MFDEVWMSGLLADGPELGSVGIAPVEPGLDVDKAQAHQFRFCFGRGETGAQPRCCVPRDLGSAQGKMSQRV